MKLRWFSLMAVAGLLIAGPGLPAQEAPSRTRALLGVLVEPTSPGATNPGMKVLEVTPGSPAAGAGVQRGDVITKLDDQKMSDIDQFFNFLAHHQPGDKVKVFVQREGKEQTLNATLGERRPRGERVRPAAFLGVDTEALNADLKNRAGVGVDAGAYVQEVLPDSPAAKAGLQRGDVIVAINGKNVAGPDDLRAEVATAKPDSEATLKVARGKETKELKAKLQAPPAMTFPPPFRELPGPLGSLERRIESLEKRVQELEKKLNEKK